MIKPIRTQILVKPFSVNGVSEGGIIVPESIRERSSKARVIAVGDGIPGKPMRYKPGDTVWHVKGTGTPIEVDGETVYFLDSDIELNYILAYTEN